MIDTTFLVRVAAGFSIAGCIAVFYDLWSQRSPRSQSLWYTFLLCLLDLGDAGTKFAARQALDGDQTSSNMVIVDGNLTHITTDINASPTSFACQLQGFIIQWLTLAAALASSLVALNLAAAFLLGHQRSVIQRRQKFLLCSFLLTSFTVAMLPIAVRGSGGSIAYGDGDVWCWIAEDQTILRVILWLGPISLLSLFNITVFVLVAYIIRRTIRRKYAAFTANQHQRLAKYHSLYLRTITIQALLLGLAWGPTLVARYYQLATDGALPYSMAAALAVLSPLRGFFHALAYFGQAFLNRPWRRTGVNPPIKGEEYRQRKAEHGHFFSPANLLSRTNVPDGTIELIHADQHLPQLLSSEYSQGSSTHGTIPSPRPFLEPRSHSEIGSRLDIVSSWMYKELSVNESRSRPSWNPVAPYDRPASAPLTASLLSPPRPPYCRMSVSASAIPTAAAKRGTWDVPRCRDLLGRLSAVDPARTPSTTPPPPVPRGPTASLPPNATHQTSQVLRRYLDNPHAMSTPFLPPPPPPRRHQHYQRSRTTGLSRPPTLPTMPTDLNFDQTFTTGDRLVDQLASALHGTLRIPASPTMAVCSLRYSHLPPPPPLPFAFGSAAVPSNQRISSFRDSSQRVHQSIQMHRYNFDKWDPASFYSFLDFGQNPKLSLYRFGPKNRRNGGQFQGSIM